jgi:archaellum component FlaC
MSDAILELLRVIQSDLASVKGDLAGVKADLRSMRAQLDGLPLINHTVTVIQQEVRALRAAFNDFALTVGKLQHK